MEIMQKNQVLDDFRKQIVDCLEKLKSSFENKQQVKNCVKQDLNKLLKNSFEKEILKKEQEKALKNFDIAYANKLATQIENLDMLLEIQKEQQNSKEEDELHRDMAFDVFSRLKQLSKEQIKEILETTPQIKNYLEDWFQVLVSWLR